MCQRSFKKVSRVFHKSFKGVSTKIEGCSKRVFSGFQGYLNEFQREFPGVPRMFLGCFKEVSRVF